MAAPRTRKVTITLPENLAAVADELGILNERWLGEAVTAAVQRAALDSVLAARDAGLFDPLMTYEELEQEIDAARADIARRATRSA